MPHRISVEKVSVESTSAWGRGTFRVLSTDPDVRTQESLYRPRLRVGGESIETQMSGHRSVYVNKPRPWDNLREQRWAREHLTVNTNRL